MFKIYNKKLNLIKIFTYIYIKIIFFLNLERDELAQFLQKLD